MIIYLFIYLLLLLLLLLYIPIVGLKRFIMNVSIENTKKCQLSYKTLNIIVIIILNDLLILLF